MAPLAPSWVLGICNVQGGRCTDCASSLATTQSPDVTGKVVRLGFCIGSHRRANGKVKDVCSASATVETANAGCTLEAMSYSDVSRNLGRINLTDSRLGEKVATYGDDHAHEVRLPTLNVRRSGLRPWSASSVDRCPWEERQLSAESRSGAQRLQLFRVKRTSMQVGQTDCV